MSKQSWALQDAMRKYVHAHGVRESPAAAALRSRTARLGRISNMQICPEQGALMALLAHSIQAERALEIGTFTGYSALVVAEALKPGGKLLTCDVSEKWTSIAKEFWQKAGVAEKIELRLGPAIDTLNELTHSGQRRSFDFAFIDADKENYEKYYESALGLTRPGGLVCVDNVFWGGSVADPERKDEAVEAIRRVTRVIHADERVDAVIVPVGDGLMVARKRH